jgi:hypothetical protein
MPNDGLLIKGVGVWVLEDSTCRNQGVGYGLACWAADPQLDAGRIDTFLLHEVLAGIECTFGSGIGLFCRIGVANHDQVGIGLLLEGESDVVEAALGLVVDTDGSFAVTIEGDRAEVLCRGRRRDRRSVDADRGCSGGLLA